MKKSLSDARGLLAALTLLAAAVPLAAQAQGPRGPSRVRLAKAAPGSGAALPELRGGDGSAPSRPDAASPPAESRPDAKADTRLDNRADALRPLASGGDTVAVFEYRNDVKQMSDLPERLVQALRQNTSLQVLTLTDARRQLGAGVDAEVARCDGETRCLSAVGERLRAREVLLLAVSQLGDVVMALQRIDVGERRVVTRYADSIVSGQLVDEARVLGWLQQLYPPEMFKRYGKIRITTDVEGAQVYVNAKGRGKTPLAEPISVLAPGNYRLLVEKDRYIPFQAGVSVMPETTVEVTAHLAAESRPKPWYKQWYTWVGIGGGLAAGAAVGVAVYYATNQPAIDMMHVPGTVVFK